MKAVIMAGGKGTRLRPLTCSLPKPMVPLLDNPCMEYIIELLRAHGITEIAVTTQYLPEVIRDYFGDGRSFGVQLTYFEEKQPLGTAGSVKNAQSFLDERFLVISGDALTDFNLTEAIEYHIQQCSMATILLSKVSDPREFGIVMTDPGGRINRFLEKPDWSEVFTDTVNTGIYVLEPDVLTWIDLDVESDFSRQLFPCLLEKGKPMYGFVCKGYWSDIGDIHQYRRTQFDMLEGRVQVQIKGNKRGPGIYVGDNVKIHPTAQISGPAFIGDGTCLEERVTIEPYSVICQNNTILKGSTLNGSILWKGNHLREDTCVNGSIVCGHVTVNTGGSLHNGSVVGSHCTIGEKAQVLSNVRIWPKKRIQSHAQVLHSLIWGDIISKSLFHSGTVAGIPNVEITPEFAGRFMTAYGSCFAPGQTLTISSSAQPFADIIMKAAVSALQSVGIHVIDLGHITSAALQFGIRSLQADGGIHIQLNAGCSPENCILECYDANGWPVHNSMQRKAENAYYQEDYRRAPLSQLGRYGVYRETMRTYLARIHQQLRLEESPAANFRIVLASTHLLYTVIAKLLQDMKCQWIHISGTIPENELRELVRLNGADLGIVADDSGRDIEFITASGKRVAGDRSTLVKLLSFFQLFPDQTVSIPASTPAVIDSLAQGMGGKVIRTKDNMRAVMEAVPNLDIHPLFDGVFAVAVILQNMLKAGITLDQMVDMVPDFYLLREKVHCAWEAKGKILRMMMETYKDREPDLLDGIRLNHENDWVLLLPQADEPAFNVIAYALNEEKARSLMSEYKNEILQHTH